jgi:hypothetical protein
MGKILFNEGTMCPRLLMSMFLFNEGAILCYFIRKLL